MKFLQEYQLNFMLLLSGICATIALFVYLTPTIKPKRRKSLLYMELGAMALLMADRYAYTYRGSASKVGFVMVRASNYAVFFLIMFMIYAFNYYLTDLYESSNEKKQLPKRLKLTEYLFYLGTVLLTISQFTGLYYTFDADNYYHRSAGFIICYTIPLLMILLQLSVILQYYRELSPRVRIAMLFFTVMPLAASIVQIFTYGISLVDITMVGMVVLLYVFTLLDTNKTIERAQELEMAYLKEEQQHFRLVFEQTAEALATAIDAKDKYTHGHSRRVAEYSEKIARLAGMDDKACQEIYFAALLHDVGKIGIPDAIINKEGKLTDEEFAEIKKHPIIGKQILSSINRSPYLSIGANYHHERYDGKGYPEGLKGKAIPEIARVIAVADAYDAMTSKRSYRDPIPQQLVREEFVKGIETQFDPVYAKIMLHLIDIDTEYSMKEQSDNNNLSKGLVMNFDEYRSDYSDGIQIKDTFTDIVIRSTTDRKHLSLENQPAVILFDSLDGSVHEDERKAKSMVYFEYAEIKFDGTAICKGARKIKTEITELKPIDEKELLRHYSTGINFEVETVRYKDHVRIIITNDYRKIDVIAALPDSSRFSYVSFTGKNCTISHTEITHTDVKVSERFIPRIADIISYIDAPEGDIPNVQIDGWVSAATDGILVDNKLKINLHAMSLPTARLVWHCPFVVIFTSIDGKMYGDHYQEFAMVRMDGESWENDITAKNTLQVKKTADFDGWDNWKKRNKEGVDCSVTIIRKDNTVTVSTENCGIITYNVTNITDEVGDIYAALTGDQCALTNIRISTSLIAHIPLKKHIAPKQ